MTTETVRLSWQEGCNIIVGQSHFIKTVEDIGEIMAVAAPGKTWGLAFSEASGACLVRVEGNDPELVEQAAANALAVAAGHSFYLVLGPGLYPIQVLDRIKACPEVCRVFCATGNPVELVVARTEQGGAILGVVDGFPPRGIETPADQVARKALLRTFGYKY